MRILHTVVVLDRGGAERVVLQLLEGQTGRGHEAGLLAGPGPLEAEVAALGVPRRSLPAPRSRSPVAVVRGAIAVAAAVRDLRPDVVHAHNVRATALAVLGVRLALVRRAPPVLSTFHGVAPEEYEGAARVLRRSGLVACVSSDLRDKLAALGLAPARLAVVENAVAPAAPLAEDTRRRLDEELALQGPVVAIVGRLVPQKAHERFLAAAAIVAAQRPDVTFLVVGDGHLRADLEERARALGVDRAVRFAGLRSDARDLIARADLLVFSSVWEGLSIAALEALTAGTPVVTTAAEGMAALADAGAAVTVPVGDDDALAAAVLALLADEDRRRRMGEAGRRLADSRFALPTMLSAYERLYETVRGR